MYGFQTGKDWEKNWLGQPKLKEDIGKVFHYDSGCSYTLSRIVTKVMGENCLSIMQKRVLTNLVWKDQLAYKS